MNMLKDKLGNLGITTFMCHFSLIADVRVSEAR